MCEFGPVGGAPGYPSHLALSVVDRIEGHRPAAARIRVADIMRACRPTSPISLRMTRRLEPSLLASLLVECHAETEP